ncbi:MAG: hypothetical protein E7773_10270 [Sphingomonas sp.]|uniref:hypothetical protein n=1 Tax=Sphingomonas sp. TaxID=28214 RepID=UPI00121D4E9F|nr:hypothetical protein [Sphingomonas sp.]THD35723.1 MAG: hypothetical protein E7773_10270 [Sphingomonas sp.]
MGNQSADQWRSFIYSLRQSVDAGYPPEPGFQGRAGKLRISYAPRGDDMGEWTLSGAGWRARVFERWQPEEGDALSEVEDVSAVMLAGDEASAFAEIAALAEVRVSVGFRNRAISKRSTYHFEREERVGEIEIIE